MSMCLRLYVILGDVRRYTFVVAAVDARVELVRNFGVMGAVVGGLGRHGSNVEAIIILDWT